MMPLCLGCLEGVASSQQAADVEAVGFGFDPGSIDVLLGAFLAGYRTQGVLSGKAGTFLAEAEVPRQQIVVVVHLADLIQLFEDGFLGQAQDLDVAGVEVVDRDGNGKFDVDGAGTATAFAGFEVTHLGCHVFGGGLEVEAEGLGAGSVGAPALVELQRLVTEKGEADGATIGELGNLEVAAAGAGAGNGC